MNILNGFINFLKGKQAQRFYWNTLNGALGLCVAYLMGIDLTSLSVPEIMMIGSLIAMLNGLTKEVNNYLKK